MKIKLAVFGNPVAHSLSPLIHQHFAAQCGHAVSYDRILVDQDFASQVQAFYRTGAQGCNITVPCKLDAYALSTELTARASLAKAVNTLKFLGFDEDQQRLLALGDNTDGAGFFQDLQRLKFPLKQAKILILGAGGATRGILPPLMDKSAQVSSICLVNRTPAKALAILDDLHAQIAGAEHLALSACSYDNLSPDRDFDLIINATSLSLHQKLPALPDALYRKASMVYDLYYTPTGTTVFTAHARALGVAQCVDGLGMLVGQAALSYQLWTGTLPDIQSTLTYMRTVLQERA